jgi:hypothetical protein
MLKWEDQLRSHPAYIKAAIEASKVGLLMIASNHKLTISTPSDFHIGFRRSFHCYFIIFHQAADRRREKGQEEGEEGRTEGARG